MDSRTPLILTHDRTLLYRSFFRHLIRGPYYLITLLTAMSLNTSFAAVSITEVQQHRFPDAVASSKTGKITLNWKGNVANVVNTQIVGDYWSSGEFVLQSNSSSTISINVYSNQDIPGVTLKTIRFRYKGKTYKTFPVSGLPNPGAGSNAQLGMRILFSKNVEPGEITPAYTIEVTEDNP
jgi:hypothetical protein